MNNQAISFREIFNVKAEVKEEEVKVSKIVIPKIQRDYAQGRKNLQANRVRERFLDSLYDTIVNDKQIKLDFIYGDVDEKGVLTPLDGQQRLTTLFLLHWYAAKKENIEESEYGFLKNFSYATRPSARDFCKKIIKFNPEFTGQLSKEIEDTAWFPLSWKKDATVKAMLVMLDAIEQKFKNVTGIWEKLTGKNITFYFRSIGEMGVTDELYIRMNARGKSLTTFEHFKAEFEHYLKEIDENFAQHIMSKIDREWTDLLWCYRNKKNEIDDAFLRYFRFICDILCFESGNSTSNDPKDEFDLLKKYFSTENPQARKNVEFLEKYFNIWYPKRGKTEEFFNKFLSKTHESGKIIYSGETDIFKNCLNKYANVGDDVTDKNRIFSFSEVVRLYAFTIYLLNEDGITENDFSRRLRIVNNLILNSDDELNNDSETRRGGNRIPECLKYVKEIIVNGTVLNGKGAFNGHQLQEETQKLQWTENNPALAESLFELEDNNYLFGQIAAVGLENYDNFKKFGELFSCDVNEINRALLATGNYMQWDRNWYRLGANWRSVWVNLFHKSNAVSNFDETKKVLNSLLSSRTDFSDSVLKDISESYLKTCESKKEYDWRYYFVKYPEFMPKRYGKYGWDDFENKPYEVLALWTDKKRSPAAYQPFLKQAMVDTGKGKMSEDPYNPAWLLDDKLIKCVQEGYVVYAADGTKLKSIDVLQNADGVDTEDRIEKLKAELANE